ncbi:hypothetical protein GKQ77_14705 [Streptomyces sp. BG9H]|uniref:Secreted protein n=1 Tax=Streptomyces anatolicus TaxID=2675858 RepID=A0ABS6YN59_9ACTN|nr:hypothetical protein [Streptomyces anatolicus]MBW5422797.1 hypothetical protein [Streptomyces anatolicus]
MPVGPRARARNRNTPGRGPTWGGPGLRTLLAGAVACAAALAVSPASQATASAGCQTRADARHTDWTGMHFLGDVVCPHNTGSIRVQSTTDSSVNGQIAFSPSWFVCWKRGSPYQGGDIWYYTQGDTVSGGRTAKGWGYLPAAELASATHPVPGLDQCTWS